MKFVIQRNRLVDSIQDVMKAISSRAAIPILTGIKIEAKKHGITLTGSDSDISIESYIPSEQDGEINVDQIIEGSIVIDARYFPDIIRKLPENTVEISVSDQLLVTIRSGKAEFNINGLDADEYPLLPEVQTEDSFTMPIDLLKYMISQTVFAVSTMETRPILTGVNMTLKDNRLNFTATDSHRLASRHVPIDANGLEFSNVVVPGKSLNELNKILDDTEELVEISVTANQILFKSKHLNFMSRLLEGNYPETSRLIPTQSKTTLYANTKELIQAIDRASLLAKDERNNVVRLSTINEQLIEIMSHSPEIGHVEEEIPIKAIEGEELNISFSSKYMLDGLRAIHSDEVSIEFTGSMRPFIIRPINGEEVLQLILPVRTY